MDKIKPILRWLATFPKRRPMVFGFLLGFLFVKLGFGVWVHSELQSTPIAPAVNWMDVNLDALAGRVEGCSVAGSLWDKVTFWNKSC